jgi:hypothetical protein
MKLLVKTFPTSYRALKTEIVCKCYDPREVDVLTYPNGAHVTFGASSPRVRFYENSSILSLLLLLPQILSVNLCIIV